MTNNPVKITGLKGYGLEITERVPIEVDSNPFNEEYLNTKVIKMGHVISNSMCKELEKEEPKN